MEKVDEAKAEVKPSKYDRAENWVPPAPKKKAAAKVAEDDDDALMSFDAKPKRAPPKGIGIKPKKKAPAADAEMTEEAPKPPARKPPALSSDRPKTTAASSGKAPSAPIIKDEDLGSGVSKEEAIDKVNDFYDAGTVAKFEDAKWQVKLEGFEELKEAITDK